MPSTTSARAQEPSESAIKPGEPLTTKDLSLKQSKAIVSAAFNKARRSTPR